MSYQEEPFASGSVLAQYKVFQAAKQNGVTVLLDGQGADEILAGYHKYYKWYWQELYRTKKLRASGELKNAEALGLGQSFGLKNKIAALFPEFAAGILQSGKERKAFHHRIRRFSGKRRQRLATSHRAWVLLKKRPPR